MRTRFEIADTADDIARVLDVLGLGSVSLVGYSMGGMTAQELALRYPGRVCGWSSLRLPHIRCRGRGHTWCRSSSWGALSRIDKTVLPRIAHRYLMRGGVIPPEHAAWLWQVLLDRDNDLYYEAGFALLRFDARDRVAGISVPTLCIVPTEDQLITAGQQYDTASRIEGSTLVELVGARHEAVLTHADDIAKAIVGFV